MTTILIEVSIKLVHHVLLSLPLSPSSSFSSLSSPPLLVLSPVFFTNIWSWGGLVSLCCVLSHLTDVFSDIWITEVWSWHCVLSHPVLEHYCHTPHTHYQLSRPAPIPSLIRASDWSVSVNSASDWLRQELQCKHCWISWSVWRSRDCEELIILAKIDLRSQATICHHFSTFLLSTTIFLRPSVQQWMKNIYCCTLDRMLCLITDCSSISGQAVTWVI